MARIKPSKDGRIVVPCLKCGRKLFVYDGKSTIYHEVKCPGCSILTRYHPTTGIAELREIPERQCSSGLRFY